MGMTPNLRNGKTTLSEINVTPLVDVMLVLLIVFMVSAPLMQQGVQVELPKTKAQSMSTQKDPVTLTIQKEGDVSWNGSTLSFEKFQEKIAKEGAKLAQSETQILVKGDARAPYGVVAKVMAELSRSRLTKVGLVTAPEEGKNE